MPANSRAPCIAPAPLPANAPPPTLPTKNAFRRRKLASASVNVSSIDIRFRIANSSCANSAVPSSAAPFAKFLPVASANRPMTEFGPADFRLASLLRSFTNPASPKTPIAACGSATKPALMACTLSISRPDSRASLTLLPVMGAYSETPAPRSAPCFKLFLTPPFRAIM